MEVPLTDGEEVDWGSELEQELEWAAPAETPPRARKSASGTRLDESMESQAQQSHQKGRGKARTSAPTPVEEQETKPIKLNKVKTSSICKKEQTLAVTGLNAEFPTLGMTVSHDAVFNMSWIIHGRLIVHKWKQLVWMVRVKDALAADGRRFKRHPRWLALMFSREVAALWGHLGTTTKTLAGPRGPPLMK